MTLENQFGRKKDRKKAVRTVFEAAALVVLLIVVIKNLFILSEYEPYNEEETVMSTEDNDAGFIALSYFGIARDATETLVSTDTLDAHLQALYNAGYVTISQQDLIDYYENGKELPEKSLFLMFEDGRRDTTIFAEKVTEKYNYLSTILTYANKFEDNDPTFLQPKNVESLLDSTYWELGTNGYRLEYINAYDRYDRFLGCLDTKEYMEIHEYLGRDYNHYLMDYIRDEYKIPTESYAEMKDRIDTDYDLMDQIYTEKLGELPQLYVLMHANTGQFGENKKVSSVNEENILNYFTMNFNREGFSVNNRENSIYDLTRMQPQPYWHTNHLLMRIKDDTGQTVDWVLGDEDRMKKWTLLNGAAEFAGDEIYLTCESMGVGTLRLEENQFDDDFIFTAELQGNALGKQAVYIRADEELQDYLEVSVENKKLVIRDASSGTLYEKPVDELTNAEKISVDEDSQAALIQEKTTALKYAESVEEAEALTAELAELNGESVQTVEEGAEEYEPELELNEAADYELTIAMKDNRLTVLVDGFTAVEDLETEAGDGGCLFIQSGWGGESYSQRNLADDVYDGVFKNIVVTANTGADKEEVLFDNSLHGFEKFADEVKTWWHKIVNFFINTF